MKSLSFKISVVFILALSIVSIFAYLVIPDKSSNANQQQLEIALKAPFFKTDVLLLNENVKDRPSFIKRLFFGESLQSNFLPIKTYHFLKDEVQISTPIGRNKIFNKDQLKFPGSLEKNIIQKSYLFGTDRYGRCVLSRLILGIRVSLFIGFLAVIVSVFIGITLGAIAAYFGGIIDQLILYIINVTWSLPTLLLVFAIVLSFGKSISIIFLAVGLTMWVDVARIVRGQILSIKTQQYITAAKGLAYSHKTIILKHILPNILGPILVIASANFAIAILIESGLSYLGFGIQPPAPSIGNMLYENYGYAISGKPFIALIPALMIMSLVLMFNIIGSGLRDKFDLKS